MTKLHAGHIEIAVVNLLNYRIYTVVPNVSWGLGLRHECDLLALDSSDRLTEIEIKISAHDLKADFKKAHGHESDIIGRLVYAMPMTLVESHGHLIPQYAGIIGVRVLPVRRTPGQFYAKAEWVRRARFHKNCVVGAKIIRDFMRLGCMRIWSLKQHNNKGITP